MLFVCSWLFFAIFHPVFGETVDLTWPFDNETIYWPGVTPFHYTKKVGSTDRGFWYAMNEFGAGEHGGTHFDAPYHFNRGGWKVGEVPVSRLIAKGAVLEVTGTLRPQDLDAWVKENGQFEENTVLLVRFNWSRFWPDRKEYMAMDETGNPNFPGLSAEAADWIARSGKIVGVGVDTASVDRGGESEMVAHRALSAKQIYNLENVKLVDVLPVRGFTLIVAPMKLRDGTGAPVRIFAVLNTKIPRPAASRGDVVTNEVGNYESIPFLFSPFILAPYYVLL